VTAIITVATTGPIATKADNPTLPTTPEEIAAEVEAAYHEGASVAHIHLRDEAQRPTADLGIARQVMDLIAARCPILVQMSTGVGLDVPYDTGHLEACLQLHEEGLLAQPLQFSIVLGVKGGMTATADNLITMVRRLPAGAIWQVIAIGRANLELTATGLALGGNARAGMEDTLYLRKGQQAQGNTLLVRRAVKLARDLDRTAASVAEAEALLGLPSPT
jgi:uncharacterized protein (DUF849 family)